MAARRLSGLVSAAAGVFDRAYLAVVAGGGKPRGPEALGHDARVAALRQIASPYAGVTTETFFPAPPLPAMSVRSIGPGVDEATWPSAATPFLADVADRWWSRVENRTARARFYTVPSARPRPLALLVHGYMGGSWVIEENQWPIAWLLRRGLDVALAILPLHGARAGARRGPPGFPSSDPRLTNEGFRQAVTDLRSVIRYARERRSATRVGVMGMSLGGFTASLLATVAAPGEVDFLVPIIPLASLADFAREQGRLGEGPLASVQHAELERAHAIVSPLARPPQVRASGVLVVAAEDDRVTPVAHARRLAQHFACELFVMPGGHLLQVGRGQAFRAIGRMLAREGVLAQRGG